MMVRLSYCLSVLAFMMIFISCAKGSKTHKLVYSDITARRTLGRIHFIRGLKKLRPISVQVVGEPEFHIVVKRLLDSSKMDKLGDSNFQYDDKLANKKIEKLMLDGLNRFPAIYDKTDKIAYIKKKASTKDSELSEGILAQVLFNALQDQHFGMHDFATYRGYDTRHALNALYRADMLIVGELCAVHKAGHDWKEYFTQMSRRIHSGIADAELFYGDKRQSAGKLQHHFYSIASIAFVYELYRKGGFDMVNAAYKHPPTTTEQIFHPQKYLKGEPGMNFTAEPSFQGLPIARNITAGELSIRNFLYFVIDWESACNVASGWGGDRLFVLNNQKGDHVFVWYIAWDSPDGSEKFEKVLEMLQNSNRMGFGLFSPMASKEGNLKFTRRDNLVGVTYGLPEEDSRLALDVLKEDVFEKMPPKPPVLSR